jgi:cell division protein FtsW
VEARRRKAERETAGRGVSGAQRAGSKVVPLERRARRTRKAGLTGTDYTLLSLVILMSLYGMVMIFSASSGSALHHYGSSYYFLVRQAAWFGVGMVALAALAGMDYRKLLKASPLLVIVSLAALAAVLAFGREVYGSRRSLVLGPLVIQPSELAKMSLLLFAVYWYGRKRARLESWREILFPVLAVTAAACLLIILEPDLGSMLIAGLSAFVVLYLAGAKRGKVLALAVSSLGLTLLFIRFSHYRWNRFLAFLDPWSAPREGGFHIIQSLLALGSGRVVGLGLGMSRQKFFYLPNAHTDFIFSIIGEELGLVGCLAVVGLFAVFVYLGLKIARGADDGFGRLLAMGVTCVIGAQALINMGAACGVMPITGITLPYFSYGGSSLVICLCLAGILISVSRHGGRAGPGADGRRRRESGDLRRGNRRPPSPPARGGRGARIA